MPAKIQQIMNNFIMPTVCVMDKQIKEIKVFIEISYICSTKQIKNAHL